MPSFLAHVAVGLALGLVVLSLFGFVPTNSGMFIITILLLMGSSAIPDIDHEDSFATRASIWLASLVVVYVFNKHIERFVRALFDNILLEALSLLIILVIVHHLITKVYKVLKPEHRGFIHSYAAAGTFIISVYLISQDMYASIVVGIGYISHLWADGLFFKLT